MNTKLKRPDDFYMYDPSTLRPKEMVMSEDAPEPVWNIYKTDFTKGVRKTAEGASFPFKLSHQEIIAINSMFCIDILKRFVVEIGKLFPIPTLKKSVNAFNSIMIKVMGQFIVSRKYMNPLPNEIWAFLSDFLVELKIKRADAEITASIIANIFQYDLAYYLRVLDLASNTTKKKLLDDPRGELARIQKIHEARDINEGVKGNFRKMAKIARFILLFPSVRSAFRKAMTKRDFSNFQYDEADRYFACLRQDYLHFGMSIKERRELMKKNGWLLPIDFSGRPQEIL